MKCAHRLLLRLIAVAALLASSAAFAVTCTTVGAGGAWNVAATWERVPAGGLAGCDGAGGAVAGTPGPLDDVIIAVGSPVTTLGAAQQARNLTVTGTLTTGSFGLTIQNNGVVQIDGVVQGNGAAASLFTKTGTGGLSGVGSFNNLQQVNINGNTTIAGGSSLTFTGLECRLALAAGVTLTNSGTVTFDTPASCATASTLTLTATSVWTNNGTITAGTVTGASGAIWNNNTNSTVSVKAAFLTTAGTVLNASALNNTVNYSGAVAQTVKVPSASDYFHLTFSGSNNRNPVTASTYDILGNFTVGAGVTWNGANPAIDPAVNITGNLVNNGTLVTGDGAYTLGGNFTNNSTFTHTAAGTFTLNGTAAQAIGGTAAATFLTLTITNTSAAVTANTNFSATTTLNMNGANTLLTPAAGVIVSGAGNLTGTGTVQVTRILATPDFSSQYTITTKTLTNLTVEYSGPAAQTVSALSYGKLKINNASGVTLAGNATVNLTLTLASGNVTTGASTLITASSCATPSVVRTSGHVIGNLRKAIPAGASSCTFEVGSAAGYIPIGTTFVAGTTAGNITASATGTEHPSHGIGPSAIDTAKSVNRYWTLTNGAAPLITLPAAGFTAVFNFLTPGDYDALGDPAKFTVQRFSGGSWFATTVNAACTPVAGPYLCNQVNGLTAAAGFGDFAIGEANYTGGNAGWYNAFETTTGAGLTVGSVFTKIVGTAFNLDLVAVNALRNGVKPNYSTNPVTVELLDATDNSGALTAETGCRASWTLVPGQSFSLSPAWASSRATVAIPAQARALREGRIRVTQGTLIGCSSDNFAIRPASFSSVVSGAPLNMNNVGTSGAPSAIAGSGTFTLIAATSAAGYTGIPKIDNTAVEAHASAIQNGAVSGTFPAALTATGTSTGTSAFIYSEVGNFRFLGSAAGAGSTTARGVYDDTFTAVDGASDCTADFSNALDGSGKYGCKFGVTANTGFFGRFYPANFVLTPGTFTNRRIAACAPASAFTYAGEEFRVTLTLTAKNGAGVPVTAQNYDPAAGFASFDAATIANLGFGAIDLADATPPLTATALTASLTSGTSSGTWASGAVPVTADLMLTRAASPNGPFESFKLGIDPVDADGVKLSSYDLDTTVPADTNDRGLVGTSKIRFGRLRLRNALGSELIDLPIPMVAQYWNASTFVTNPDDSCTSLSAANLSLGVYTGGITGVNLGAPGHISLGGAFASGVGSLKLTKPAPVPASPGSATVTVNLGAEAKSYLLGNWGVSTYTVNPGARAGFGLFSSQPRNFIFYRENH